MTALAYRRHVLVMWLVIAALLFAVGGPRAYTAASWDTDDFMRLVQVRDLLSGQAFTDLTQHRLHPPQGTPMHWSRLPDLPLAAVTFALLPWLARDDALAAAAMIVPPLYLLAFLACYAVAARLVLGAGRAPVALIVAMTGSGVLAQFAPGRADHHGLQLVLMTAATTLLLVGVARERWRSRIAWAGVPFALSVWVGVETLPVIAAWCAALGAVWCHEGRDFARQGARAAGLAALLATAILFVVQPAERLWAPACDAFSPMPVGALALAAAAFAGMHSTARQARRARTRVAIGVVWTAAAVLAFARLFPTCVAGGYGAVDPLVREHWLAYVAEARSFAWVAAHAPLVALGQAWTPLLALAYCAVRLARTRGRAHALWLALAVMLALDTAMLAWQLRAATFAHAAALLPLSGLVIAVWQRIARRGGSLRRLALLLPVLLVCSVAFWPLIGAGLRLAATWIPGAPAPARLVAKTCAFRDPVPPLAAEPPVLILSYIDLGPVLLFATPHAVLGAPYHRNDAGLAATIALFRERDDAALAARLHTLGVRYVVTCPGMEENTVYRTQARDGLAERLAAGRVPAYLEPLPDAAHPSLRVFQVLR